jgi:arabinose-5-phosphate isomerase
MDYIKRAQDVIDCEIAGLQSVHRSLGEGFASAVDAILDCLKNRGKVVISGMGKNLHIAQKISATLASTGTTSVVLNPTQAMHGDLGILQAGDVLLALSYSGESEELLAVVPIAKRMGVTIVAVTGVADSALAQDSDIVVPAAVECEACPFNMAPTASTTATLALGDALAMVLLDARGFKKEDYAKLHPSGAIGRALLLRVRDIMRRDDRVATIQSGASVKDALLAMTEARAGSAGIVNSDQALMGIFTDGDLRRHIGKHANILEQPIDTLMTPNPLTVREDELAVDVLHIFETHNIDDLLVVDSDNRVVGAVDIQDLPKLKIL